jgi:glycosyltransferase involved in cell wall biosynthesis
MRSVLDQDYAALEYVICDGGSTDETAAILARYADRVTVMCEPDRGQADAVNKGIRATTGQLIGWLNSDDLYAPRALAIVSDFLEANPAVDVVYGDAQLIDAEDCPIGAYYTEPWNPARLPVRCFLCQPAVFFRRRVVERWGLLDERLHYCLDYEYWLRLTAGGARFAYLPQVLAGSRLHSETKTLSARLPYHEEINTMLRNRLGQVPDSWLLNHAHTLVELRRSSGAHRVPLLPYALEVVLEAARLSFAWNHRLSRGLISQSLGPIVAGARRRLGQSRSAATTRPAS